MAKPKKKSGLGRPSKFWSPEIRKAILDAIALGCSETTAAGAAGVDHSTLSKWKARGRVEKEGDFADFFTALEKAVHQGELRHVIQINRAANEGNWTASAWFLERRHHKRWGQKTLIRVEMEREYEDAFRRMRAALTPDEYERAVTAIVAPDSGDEADGALSEPAADQALDS